MAQRIRVLIVDDSAHARQGLRVLLATLPEVEVVGEAFNGREALRCIGEIHPELVLMDVQMPVMDGLQATRLIKNNWPDVTVIILTMHATAETTARAAGADDFIIKGCAPDRLLSALGIAGIVGERPSSNATLRHSHL